MPHAPVPTFSLGIPHFVEFMDAYRGFPEGLDSGQRRLVLYASGLVSWTDERGDALAAAFDRTLAVLNSGGDTDAEPDLDGLAEAPGSPGEYHEMFACTAIFVDSVQALLPDITEMARGVGRWGRGGRPASYRVDTDGSAKAVGARLEEARKRAESEFPGMPWDSLLGAAAIRIEAGGGGEGSSGGK